ncbi:hypothetical protein [Mangrovibacterium lignilyticum]|uniref:hypothetical protein n=1 Tax=Mangrovibacterium lignilyticum TaxID=2668052 RepID=UPI0013D61C44|nr:hypothetical protein [Mangrovibacterium lignilyticum]
MKRTYQLVSLALLAGFLSPVFQSCTGKSPKKDTAEVAEEAIKKEIEEYTYPLPSTFEVTNMLNSIEASFIVGISNDPEKAESYFEEKAKALNLGIYTADLAYATTYNQKSEVQAYFTSCENLIRELDFTSAFDENLPDEIDANLDNKEKLVEIVTGMFQNAYSYLNKQGRTELSYLVLTGSVVEGLYLTTHISENTFQNPKIIEAIIFQKEALVDMEKMMEPLKDSEMLKDVYKDIQSINAIYALEEGSTAMTETQVLKLTETVSNIRAAYVQ